MQKYILFISIVIVYFGLSGCVQIREVAKTFWGSSTRVLNAARHDAESKFFACEPQSCFDAVLESVNVTSADKKTSSYQVFLKDRRKLTIILMAIPGSVDTTEVGVFFKTQEAGKTLIEISSLSSHAKSTTADFIFNALKGKYPISQ